MHQIHADGCLEGSRKENGEKETLTKSIMLCFFHCNNVRNTVASEGRELDACSMVIVGGREYLL